MTIYITQGRYTDQAIQGFVAKPEDRAAQARKLFKSAGGKMIAYYVTLGEYDFLVISEGKDLTNLV
ncbi:MAG: GYD domain-containing protein, partial [Alphaproteobacteria bacterium]